MQGAEEGLTGYLKEAGVDFTASLPCEKIKCLIADVQRSFFHVPLTREEEGVGICAGAALAGKRPAMFLQSSGVGNMLNALLSLTSFYELPLALFISQRGVYKERIAAQIPMGRGLPRILDGAGVSFTTVAAADDLIKVRELLPRIYRENRIHAFLLNPSLWEGSSRSYSPDRAAAGKRVPAAAQAKKRSKPGLSRFEVIESIAPALDGKIVVCNLGIPSKELYAVRHQPSNFYMLGSMGMATPIGLGIALSTSKEVVVIDGDGSLLMNPGTLATAAWCSPENLTIVCIDNSSYGSTGNQPTLTGTCVDLEAVARGFGIRETVRTGGRKGLVSAMKQKRKGPLFIYAPALAGNRDVPNVPLDHLENKKEVMGFLRAGRSSGIR